MRNWWLAAIGGLQGDEPSNISREGPAGAEGAGGSGGPGSGTRGRRHSWAAVRTTSWLAIEGRGADGSRAAHWHTQQPSPAAGPGTQKIRGSTSNNQRHTATRSVL